MQPNYCIRNKLQFWGQRRRRRYLKASFKERKEAIYKSMVTLLWKKNYQ